MVVLMLLLAFIVVLPAHCWFVDVFIFLTIVYRGTPTCDFLTCNSVSNLLPSCYATHTTVTLAKIFPFLVDMVSLCYQFAMCVYFVYVLLDQSGDR